MNRVLILLAAVLAGCSRQPEPVQQAKPAAPQAKPSDPYGEEFRRRWPPGQAEVSVYALTVPGGAERAGRVNAVLARGAMARASRALIRPDDQSVSDTVPVVQFNVIREEGGPESAAQTMHSVLLTTVAVNGMPAGGITRLTSSVQSLAMLSWYEWLLSRDSITIEQHGDAAGSTTRRVLPFPGVPTPEQALPLVARRIAFPRLRLGQTRTVNLLEESVPLRSVVVTISLSSERHTAAAPAGSFRTHMFTARWPGGAVRRWFVETEPPHRIVRWEFSDGERGEMTEWRTVSAESLDSAR